MRFVLFFFVTLRNNLSYCQFFELTLTLFKILAFSKYILTLTLIVFAPSSKHLCLSNSSKRSPIVDLQKASLEHKRLKEKSSIIKIFQYTGTLLQ